jgi:hypothetical protein
MSLTVCLFPNAIGYSDGGGYLWEYLNWALGLRALGCELVWLEAVSPNTPLHEIDALVTALQSRLERYGLSQCVAICSQNNRPLPKGATKSCRDLDAASEADLLLNLGYVIAPKVLRRFRRSVLVDVDPGLTQVWMSTGGMNVPPHDVYFTTGETVGQPGSLVPDCGLRWQFTPPPVHLPAWPPTPAGSEAPFTTVAHWYGGEWVEFGGESYANNKREGFQPFLALPQYVPQPLELALCLAKDDDDVRATLHQQGWCLRDAHTVAATPWDYQHYIQHSRGEFSCVKPSCVRLQNAWIGDRTICYLASGKPAVVQHTGPSRFLPDAEGLFRFRDLEEAAWALAAVGADYEGQSRHARALAEEYFDATKVASRVLERAVS